MALEMVPMAGDDHPPKVETSSIMAHRRFEILFDNLLGCSKSKYCPLGFPIKKLKERAEILAARKKCVSVVRTINGLRYSQAPGV
jgi:hypothetical protein